MIKKPKTNRRLITPFLLLLGSAIVLTGCVEKEENLSDNSPQFLAESLNTQAPVGSLQMQSHQGKTYFSFSGEPSLSLAPGGTAVLPVRFTPIYEPVSSIQVVLTYDPNVFSVLEILPAEGIQPFYSLIQNDVGKIEFVAAVDSHLFGKDVLAFSLRLAVKNNAPLGEATFQFVANELSALLPDVDNTETAVIEDLPRQSIVIRSSVSSL